MPLVLAFFFISINTYSVYNIGGGDDTKNGNVLVWNWHYNVILVHCNHNFWPLLKHFPKGYKCWSFSPLLEWNERQALIPQYIWIFSSPWPWDLTLNMPKVVQIFRWFPLMEFNRMHEKQRMTYKKKRFDNVILVPSTFNLKCSQIGTGVNKKTQLRSSYNLSSSNLHRRHCWVFSPPHTVQCLVIGCPIYCGYTYILSHYQHML